MNKNSEIRRKIIIDRICLKENYVKTNLYTDILQLFSETYWNSLNWIGFPRFSNHLTLSVLGHSYTYFYKLVLNVSES